MVLKPLPVMKHLLLLPGILLRGLVGQGIAGPDLAVGMRVRASHDLAFVFEHLHPAILAAEFFRLRN